MERVNSVVFELLNSLMQTPLRSTALAAFERISSLDATFERSYGDDDSLYDREEATEEISAIRQLNIANNHIIEHLDLELNLLNRIQRLTNDINEASRENHPHATGNFISDILIMPERDSPAMDMLANNSIISETRLRDLRDLREIWIAAKDYAEELIRSEFDPEADPSPS